MKRLKVLGLALLTLFAVAAMMSATASAALPQILPEKPAGTKGQSGETKLVTLAGGLTVICTSATSEFEFAKEGRLGPFHINFKGCTTKVAGITVKCTGLGQAENSGIILALGEFHLVYDSLATLGVAVLFLISPEVHFECPTGGTLILVKGNNLCLIKPISKTVTPPEHYELVCEQSGGDQTEHYYNDAGTEVKPLLLTSKAGGAFESSAEETKTGEVTSTEPNTEIMG